MMPFSGSLSDLTSHQWKEGRRWKAQYAFKMNKTDSTKDCQVIK